MTDLRAIGDAFANAPDGLSRQAYACFERCLDDPLLRKIRFGALGLASPSIAPDVEALLAWPGAAAFPGAARVELPVWRQGGRGGLTQELPIDDLKVGALVLTLPVLEEIRCADGSLAVEAVDIVWCDLREAAHWARCSGLGEVLGPRFIVGLKDDRPLRLHRNPLSWFRGLAAEQAAGRGSLGLCLLDPLSAAGERLLLGPPLICDDNAHAAEVDALQRRARARALKALPKPGRRFVARDRAVKAA